MLDVVIIGSGPAGLSAAIYAKRANLDAVVLEKEYLGTGQIAYSSRVDNYPGLPGIDGYSLGEAFLEHAEGLGVTIEEAEVTAITKKEQSFVISCEDGKNIEAKTVVYAAGCQNRRLGVPAAFLLRTGPRACGPAPYLFPGEAPPRSGTLRPRPHRGRSEGWWHTLL